MLFVSQTAPNEAVAGVFAAAFGAVGDALLKAEGYAKFRPKLKWLPLIFTEAWYTLDGTWAILLALMKHIAGRNSEAQFKVIRMPAQGDDPETWARRTLLITYMTISPNVIVVGIDAGKNEVLVHQISPAGVPWIARQLGAHEAG